MDGWFKVVDARDGTELYKFKLASGMISNPMTYIGPDGNQYVAIYAGIGGWMGAVALPSVSSDDPYAALGTVGAMKNWKSIRPREVSSMSLVFKLLYVAQALIVLASLTPSAAFANDVLRVCSDGNNLPFSNEAEEGFENALAQMIAADMNRTVEYTWRPQRRGFIRNTLNAESCDLVMGVPSGFELTATTQPYYRSTYATVSRSEDDLHIEALDDPRLRKLQIGIHAIGDDYSNPPPAQVLGSLGIKANVHGYSIYGDYSQPNPPRALVDAVAAGDIDVAIAWGPTAGYFAQQQDTPLDVTPIVSAPSPLPMAFSISLGLRRGEDDFKHQLEAILEERADDITALLASYGVPLLERDVQMPDRHRTGLPNFKQQSQRQDIRGAPINELAIGTCGTELPA